MVSGEIRASCIRIQAAVFVYRLICRYDMCYDACHTTWHYIRCANPCMTLAGQHAAGVACRGVQAYVRSFPGVCRGVQPRTRTRSTTALETARDAEETAAGNTQITALLSAVCGDQPGLRCASHRRTRALPRSHANVNIDGQSFH